MSHPDEEPIQVPINDRRRFDMNGNPIRFEEKAASSAEPSEVPLPVDAASLSDASPLALELEAARKRINDLARALQSLERDREEFKLRLTRERERMIDVEKGNIAVILLEAIDELDLSLRATESHRSPLAKGVELIRDNILKKVEGMGIERLALVGQPYDPNLAEAGDMEITTNPDEDQNVVSELRAGYRYKGRVIRPARVKVAKYLKPADA